MGLIENSLKNKNRILLNAKIVLKLFFILYSVIILLPNFTNDNSWYNTILLGLDPSWHMGLQYAYLQNLTYGEDIIYTFGPLGYLQVPENLFVPKINHILFGIFQLTYLLIACNLIFNKFKKNKIIDWVLIFASIPILNFLLTQPAIFVLFFSFLFLFQSLHKLNPWYFILAYLGSIVCFYIKIDTGFPLLMATLACFGLFCIKSKQPKINLWLAVFFIVSFIVSLFIFNVDIVGYLIGGFHIIKGYNVAMSTFLRENAVYYYRILKYAYLLFLLSALLSFTYKFHKKRLNISQLLQIAILVALSFVFYKKGMTRMSPGNLTYAIRGIAAVSLLFSMFITQNSWFRYAFVFQFFVFNLIIPYNSYSKNLTKLLAHNKTNFYNINKKVEFKEFVPRDSILWAYSNIEKQIGIDSLSHLNFSEVNSNQAEFIFLKKLENTVKKNSRIHRFFRTFDKNRHLTQRIYLPNRIREKLEDKTIDLFGSDIHYAYYNFLKYKGRPVFQDYAAYTGFLDGTNAASFNEKSEAPVDYILWDCFHAIDKRYKYWLCPITTRTILENYKYDDVANSNNVEYKILLKRRDKSKKIFANKLYKTGNFEINEAYKLPKEQNKILTANIAVEEKFLYKIFKMLYKIKPLVIEFYMNGGAIKRHKIIPEIINNGVIINKYVSANMRYEETKFFKNEFQYLKNIDSIKIVADTTYFKSNVNIEIFE